MFGMVLILLLITIILLICWHEINPLHRVIEYIKEEAEYYCDTDVSHYSLLALFSSSLCFQSPKSICNERQIAERMP